MRRIFRDYPFFNLQTRSNYKIRKSAPHPDRLWTISLCLWRNQIFKSVRMLDLLRSELSLSTTKAPFQICVPCCKSVLRIYSLHPSSSPWRLIWFAEVDFINGSLCISYAGPCQAWLHIGAKDLTRQKEPISLGQGRPTSHVVHQNRSTNNVNVVCEIIDTDRGFCFVLLLSHNNKCSRDDLAAVRLKIHFRTSTQHCLHQQSFLLLSDPR